MARGGKPLKRFSIIRTLNTRLKPGANETRGNVEFLAVCEKKRF
jgi:hypothetical protein